MSVGRCGILPHRRGYWPSQPIRSSAWGRVSVTGPFGRNGRMLPRRKRQDAASTWCSPAHNGWTRFSAVVSNCRAVDRKFSYNVTIMSAEFSDAELLAYLDEGLPVERMAAVETALRASADLRNRTA